MLNLRLGFKIYDNDWFLRYGFSPEGVADLLVRMGVTFVITQSRYLPMQDSAVESAVRDAGGRYAMLDDMAFRQALGERGIAYLGCLNICFDPAFAADRPDLLPIDQFGRREEKQDWYIGFPPTTEENIEQKITLLEKAISALDPDGIHLGFVRWPGFWEIWLPDVDRSAMPDYCYAPRTLQQFCVATGADVPLESAQAAALVISQRYRREWRDWKCSVTVAAIARIHAGIQKMRPDTPIAINTLPFFQKDFDNAVEEVFGQDIGRLSEVVDVFEVISYHQILRRDAKWPATIGSDIKRRTGRQAICTLQAKAIYLDGMHAGRGRSAKISSDEFCAVVDALEGSPVDGMCIFTFSQLLELGETVEGKNMIERLTRFRR